MYPIAALLLSKKGHIFGDEGKKYSRSSGLVSKAIFPSYSTSQMLFQRLHWGHIGFYSTSAKPYSTMCDFHNFGLIFVGQMHCLPQRLKSTLFEFFLTFSSETKIMKIRHSEGNELNQSFNVVLPIHCGYIKTHNMQKCTYLGAGLGHFSA